MLAQDKALTWSRLNTAMANNTHMKRKELQFSLTDMLSHFFCRQVTNCRKNALANSKHVIIDSVLVPSPWSLSVPFNAPFIHEFSLEPFLHVLQRLRWYYAKIAAPIKVIKTSKHMATSDLCSTQFIKWWRTSALTWLNFQSDSPKIASHINGCHLVWDLPLLDKKNTHPNGNFNQTIFNGLEQWFQVFFFHIKDNVKKIWLSNYQRYDQY